MSGAFGAFGSFGPPDAFGTGAHPGVVGVLPPGHAVGVYPGVHPGVASVAAAPVDVHGALMELGLDAETFLQIDGLAVARGAPNDGEMLNLLGEVAQAWTEFNTVVPDDDGLVQGMMVSETNPWRAVAAMSATGDPADVEMDGELYEGAGEMRAQFRDVVTQSFGEVTADRTDFLGTNALATYIQKWLELVPQNMDAEAHMASGWPTDTEDAEVSSHGFNSTVPAQLQLAMQGLGDLIYTEWELKDVKYVEMLANIVEEGGDSTAESDLTNNLMLKIGGKQEVWAAGGPSGRGMTVPFGDADYARGHFGAASAPRSGMPKGRAARCAECKRSGLPLQRGEGAFAKKKYCEDCWDEWEADTEMDGGRKRARRVQKGGMPVRSVVAEEVAEGGDDCTAFQKLMAAFGFAGVGLGFWKVLAYFDPQGAVAVGTSMSRALRDVAQGLLSTISAALRLRNLNIIKAVQDQMTMFFTWAGIDNTLTAIVTSRNRTDQRPVRSLTLQAINNIGHWWCSQFWTWEQTQASGGAQGLRKLGAGIKGVASAMLGGTVNWVRGWGKDRGHEPYDASERVAEDVGERDPAAGEQIQDAIEAVVESNAQQNLDMSERPDEAHGAVAAAVTTGALLTNPGQDGAIISAGSGLANTRAEPAKDRGAWTSHQTAAAGGAELGSIGPGVLSDHGSGVPGRRARRGGGKRRRTRRRPLGAGHKKAAPKKTQMRRRVKKGKKTRARK